MASPTNGTTETLEPSRGKGGTCSKGTPAATDDIAEVDYDKERLFQEAWPSEAPPTGMLGEMTFYYEDVLALLSFGAALEQLK
jgi:hypothetical protein